MGMRGLYAYECEDLKTHKLANLNTQNNKLKQMKRETILMGWMALIVLLLSSCGSRKSFVYLQDMQPGRSYPANFKHEAIIHRDDRLGITVNSKNPELAIPFNIQGGTFRLSSDGTVSEASGAASEVREKGYRVDVDGNIDFPILGKLHVEGLTVGQATELIKSKIQQGNYIKEPLVSIEFLNFKYTVLGAVGHTGTFNVDGDRITLIDAIAKAGDLSTKARVNRVTVIREEKDGRKMYTHDLRSKELFDSPAYYLQQNDVVYVEPKYRKKDGEDRGWQFATLFVSVASFVTSLLWVLK